MSTKYKFNGESMMHEGTEVFQIESLMNFDTPMGPVKKGDLGGYIESERNLHSGSAYSDNSWVGLDGDEEPSVVKGDSRVTSNSQVVQGSVVEGNSHIDGESVIGSGSKVSDSVISTRAKVLGDDNGNGSVVKDSTVYTSNLGGAMVDNSRIESSKLENARVKNSDVHLSQMNRNVVSLDDVRDPNISIEDSKIEDSRIGHSVNIINSTIEESDVPNRYKFENENFYLASSSLGYGSDFVHRITGTEEYEPELFDKMFEEEESSLNLTDGDLSDLNDLENEQGLNQ